MNLELGHVRLQASEISTFSQLKFLVGKDMWHNLSNSHYLIDLLDTHNTSKIPLVSRLTCATKSCSFSSSQKRKEE